jgi:cysteine-rich repeat protein
MTARLLGPVLLLALATSALGATCGNGVIEPGEACDDGNTVSGDGCSALCVFEGCSVTGTWSTYPVDATFRLAEAADGTITGVFSLGSPNPVVPVTGSRTGGTVSVSFGPSLVLTGTMDDCNDLPFSSAYLTRTRSTYCGDGVVQAPDEACDDGNFLNGDACTVDCTAATCGNGIIEGTEQCDDGNLTNGDGCSTECQVTLCGNGIIEAGEQCDDGNTINGDGCSFRCQINVCGNGIIEPGEACDDGNTVSGDGCSALCAFEGCSVTGTWRSTSPVDVIFTLAEAADGTITGVLYVSGSPTSDAPVTGSRTGGTVSVSFGSVLLTGTMDDCNDLPLSSAYLTRTRSTYCGDGVVQPTVEACDDGNFDNADGCTVSCTPPSGCGNGVVDPGEECDDANGSNRDACVNECKRNVCGDGFVHVGVEACDDGNTTSGDGCAADCMTLEAESAAGSVGGTALTITTDTEEDGATPSDPVETTLSAPAGTSSGTLTISERTAPPVAPAGFVFMGTVVHATATDVSPPPAVATPLSLAFRLDASVIASGQSENTIELRKDGEPVPACMGPVGQAIPDPCIATRERLPDGDIGIAILTTTLSDWDFSASVCGAEPFLGCQPAFSKKARFKMKNQGTRDMLGWTWKSSTQTPISIFGDPRSANDYTLCVYDTTGLLMQFTAPAGGMCDGGKPCWTPASTGFKYSDRSATHDGVSKVVLKAGDAGRAKIAMTAKGNLDLARLPLSPPVAVQVRAKDGACFQARFNAPRTNNAVAFQAANE